MAEAFAKMDGGRTVEAFSAGSRPSGKINPKAINTMEELGYDLSAHQSKSLEEVKSFAPLMQWSQWDAVMPAPGCPQRNL